jgi:hypothetical protein
LSAIASVSADPWIASSSGSSSSTPADPAEDRAEDQGHGIAELDRAHLDGDDRDEPVEQADDVEEPGRYLLGDYHRHMVVLRPAAAFCIPVLDRADDVRLVGRAELQLDLVTGVRQRVV